MATSDQGIGSDCRGKCANRTGTAIVYLEMTTLKRDKARAKLNFTRARNKLLSLLKMEELPSTRAVDDANSSLDNWLDTAIETMASLSTLYIQDNELEKGKTVVLKMDKIEHQRPRFVLIQQTMRAPWILKPHH